MSTSFNWWSPWWLIVFTDRLRKINKGIYRVSIDFLRGDGSLKWNGRHLGTRKKIRWKLCKSMTSRITIVQRNNDDEEQLLGFRLIQHHTELPNPVTPPPCVMVPSVFKNLYAPSWPSENKDRNSILHFFGCNHLTFLLLAPARILYRIYRHTYFKAYQCNASRLFLSDQFETK